jgi:hypothetical protein
MRCWDSVVSLATSYGLAGPALEFLGPKKAFEQWLPGLLPEGKSAGVGYTSTHGLFNGTLYLLRMR